MLGLALVAIAALVVIGIVLASTLGGAASPSPSPQASPSIDASATPGVSATSSETAAPEVRCEPLERLEYHIHAHLTIRFNGVIRPVPANIGILETCLYWIHTHRDSGIIHVEAPTADEYTFGQFFDIWGQPLTDQQVVDHPVASGEAVFVFVDGVRTEADPRSITLRNLENIEIQVGTEPLEPLPFEFPADFR